MNLVTSISPFARRRAALAVSVFALVGLAATTRIHASATSLPLVAFYINLLINTYYSVACFTTLTPRDDRRQPVIDAAIAGIYLVLPFTFNDPERFALVTALLFGTSLVKYGLLLHGFSDPSRLRKKLIANSIGALSCILVLAGIKAGYPNLTTTVWAVGYVLVNIYLLKINPLYRLPPPLTLEAAASRTSRIPAIAQRVFHGEIFDVYHWPQQMYDGSVARFEMLTRADTVSVLSTTADGRIVLAQQEQPDQAPYLSMFGGRIEPNESPLAAGQRELHEESGFASDDWSLWRTDQLSNKIAWTVYTYVARNCRTMGEQHLDGGERISLKSVTLDEFIALRNDPKFHEQHIFVDLERAAHDPAAKAALATLLFGQPLPN